MAFLVTIVGELLDYQNGTTSTLEGGTVELPPEATAEKMSNFNPPLSHAQTSGHRSLVKGFRGSLGLQILNWPSI